MAHQNQSIGRSRTFPKVRHEGEPSVFTCPDCQGTLFIVHHSELVRFQCRIGHKYSPESMMEAQDENVERLMWSAIRALEEQSEYISQMAQQIAKMDDGHHVGEYVQKSHAALQKAQEIRKLLTSDSLSPRREVSRTANT